MLAGNALLLIPIDFLAEIYSGYVSVKDIIKIFPASMIFIRPLQGRRFSLAQTVGCTHG
jgi:hypothetical protein